MVNRYEESILTRIDKSLDLRGRNIERVFDMFGDKLRDKGWLEIAEIAEYYLNSTNIYPVFKNTENRDKLNIRPGIVIANHPGYLDTPIITAMIKRPDVKIMSNEGFYDSLRQAMAAKMGTEFAEDFFTKHLVTKFRNEIKNRDVQAVRKAADEIAEYIARGGLFFVYPTGGGRQERNGERGGGVVDFKPIFRMLLEKIEPETMVYSIHINPEDVFALSGGYNRLERVTGFAFNFFLSDPDHIRPFGDRADIHVGEKYSQAQEWLDAMNGQKQNHFKDRALTEHFWQQFEL